MKLSEFIDDFESDDENHRQKLAKEKSYDILQYIDGVNDEIDDINAGDIMKTDAPSIFVGRGNYPDVTAGILSPVKKVDNPSDLSVNTDWYNRGMTIESVFQNRAGLLDSQKKSNTDVYDVWDGFVGTQREVAMAQEPVSVEFGVRDSPDMNIGVDDITSPRGTSVKTGAANLTENPYIPRSVEKTLEDDDWNAEGAINYLYEKGFDVYQIRDILSAGGLGNKDQRKLVPTRWSITAVDDMIGKSIREDIKSNRFINEVQVHANEFMGNRYWVIMTPGQWEFELVEMKDSGSVWNPNENNVFLSSAYEGYNGRTSYVDETAGAYYAARLGVLEYLKREKRQAKVLVLREVTDEYWAPVGVWQVRESVRNAFSGEYGTAETFLDAVSGLLSELPVEKDTLRRKSNLVSGVQQSLKSFHD